LRFGHNFKGRTTRRTLNCGYAAAVAADQHQRRANDSLLAVLAGAADLSFADLAAAIESNN
jgi:hypothetical protein